MRYRSILGVIAVVCGLICAGVAGAQQVPYDAPRHTQPPPTIGTSSEEFIGYADLGISTERDRSPAWQLAEHRRLDATLGAIPAQRKGVVDVYVLAVGLDSDPVFGREAREAGRVLARRYGAEGRTVVLAGSDGSGESTLPRGSPDNIAMVLARFAEVMDKAEDVVVLYTTSHGAQIGIAYNDADQGYGFISPSRLWSMFGTLGIERRLVIVSACYSGVFVPMLATDDSVIVTAADADHTSFGCQADSDWTFFGDALINHALRKRQPLQAADDEARGLVAGWEARGKITPSNPQIAIGSRAHLWLDKLDAAAPATPSAPVGRPAVTLLDQIAAAR
ncbi:MAG: peptidase [Sphingomonas bacterium]|nr:peptidase [Sphingomonas bacterium]